MSKTGSIMGENMKNERTICMALRIKEHVFDIIINV